jgi:hypothetical protein
LQYRLRGLHVRQKTNPTAGLAESGVNDPSSQGISLGTHTIGGWIQLATCSV